MRASSFDSCCQIMATDSVKTEDKQEQKLPPYTFGRSVKDWIHHATSQEYSDAKVEEKLLSYLPFFPESDGKRTAQVINTNIDSKNYIHEFYIENTEPASVTRDVVIIHGYAAALGLFMDNFDLLSLVPGIRIHALDLYGFGFSSRPDFPKFKYGTKQDIYKIEDWFIDSIEKWRINRKIDKFILVGHSFGGYLSSAYYRKYNRRGSESECVIEKLVLLSPVGVERSKYSYLKDETIAGHQEENNTAHELQLSREITDNQEDLVHDGNIEEFKSTNEDDSPFDSKLMRYLWERNFSPFSIVRHVGPLRSKWISGWTKRRFSHVYYQDPQHYQVIHDYIYRVFNAKGSGEYAITRVLDYGALARLPLVERIPQKVVANDTPVLWLYGDKDWMNEKAGKEAHDEINRLSGAKLKKKLSSYALISNAGHHLYLDNPAEFTEVLFDFLEIELVQEE